MSGQSLFEKVWNEHVVIPETKDTPAVFYIDLHIIHEVTTPQAFNMLRETGMPVRRPDLCLQQWITPRQQNRLLTWVPAWMRCQTRNRRTR